MNLHQQNECLKQLIDVLEFYKYKVTGVYMPSADTDGGIEVDGEYVVQIAPYHDPIYIMDVVDAPGEEIASFETPKQVELFLRMAKA